MRGFAAVLRCSRPLSCLALGCCLRACCRRIWPLLRRVELGLYCNLFMSSRRTLVTPMGLISDPFVLARRYHERRSFAMIEVTRLNGSTMVLNSDLIKTAEASPDTMLTLINGEKLIVRGTERKRLSGCSLTGPTCLPPWPGGSRLRRLCSGWPPLPAWISRTSPARRAHSRTGPGPLKLDAAILTPGQQRRKSWTKRASAGSF